MEETINIGLIVSMHLKICPRLVQKEKPKITWKKLLILNNLHSGNL